MKYGAYKLYKPWEIICFTLDGYKIVELKANY